MEILIVFIVFVPLILLCGGGTAVYEWVNKWLSSRGEMMLLRENNRAEAERLAILRDTLALLPENSEERRLFLEGQRRGCCPTAGKAKTASRTFKNY